MFIRYARVCKSNDRKVHFYACRNESQKLDLWRQNTRKKITVYVRK